METNCFIKKPHAVCVTFPAQGHLTPMIKLAKLLHSKGFYITFVDTEFNHRRLIRTQGIESVKDIPDFQFETIPEGLPPSDKDATQDPSQLCGSIRKNCFVPFRDLLSNIVSSANVPPVTCVISDGMMSIALKAAKELGIPGYQVWTASACGFLAYLHCPELIKRGILPFKDENFMTGGSLETKIDWIPGMKNMRLADLPTFIRITDPNDIVFNYLKDEAQNCLESSGLIINTFTTLEQEVLEAISAFNPHIYTVGPLSLLEKKTTGDHLNTLKTSLWKENRECLEWLDKKEPKSVIYVNYGSVIKMTDDNLKEFAWGLANSNHNFLWIMRNYILEDNSSSVTLFLKEFLEEVKDRGMISSWCPQEDVLSHPSVGVFFTHCGWNSVLESLSSGVPLICCPLFAEQSTNCKYACEEWGVGVEIGSNLKRGAIEEIVRDVLGEGEIGMKLRKRALEWKDEADIATNVGGSSYVGFERFLQKLLHCNND